MAQLDDLLGQHKLSAVDFSQDEDGAQAMHFVLDGNTYTAIEDAEDDYRSCMREIIASKLPVKNKFPACKVLGTWSKDEDEIVVLLDCKTGKPVLEVGTDHADDYYPSFVANFTPENMAINQKTKKSAAKIQAKTIPYPKKALKILGTTRDKLAKTMQKQYSVFVTEAGDWRPVVDYVLSLLETAIEKTESRDKN